MAIPSHKRPMRRGVAPRQGKGKATVSRNNSRIIFVSIGILLIVVLAVIVAIKYVRSTGSTDNTYAPAPVSTGQTTKIGEGPLDSNTAVITYATIVPPNPTSNTPLSVAYATRNSSGTGVTATYRWFVNNVLVQDGPANALQPGSYRKGAAVYAEIMLSGDNAASGAFITPAISIVNGQPDVTVVSLGPQNAAVGMVLSATPTGADPDGDPITYTYQWRVNGNPAGAPVGEGTFSTAGLQKNDSVNVAVTFTDGIANGGPVVSNSVILQNRDPQITSSAPLGLSGNQYLYQVTAKDPDDDPLSYRLDRYPAGMTIDATGLITWQLPQAVIFTGKNDVGITVTVSDGNGGTATQEWTITITDLMVN